MGVNFEGDDVNNGNITNLLVIMHAKIDLQDLTNWS